MLPLHLIFGGVAARATRDVDEAHNWRAMDFTSLAECRTLPVLIMKNTKVLGMYQKERSSVISGRCIKD